MKRTLFLSALATMAGSALAIDFGISSREYEAFMLLMFTPGYMAVYAEWRGRPPFEFLFGHQTRVDD